jgi:hypothetical protein
MSRRSYVEAELQTIRRTKAGKEAAYLAKQQGHGNQNTQTKTSDKKGNGNGSSGSKS